MRTRIDIETQTFVRFWLVVIGFALAALAIYSARDALVILGVAFFLALALNKPVSTLAKYLPGKSRVGGTAIAFIIVVALLGGFCYSSFRLSLNKQPKWPDRFLHLSIRHRRSGTDCRIWRTLWARDTVQSSTRFDQEPRDRLGDELGKQYRCWCCRQCWIEYSDSLPRHF